MPLGKPPAFNLSILACTPASTFDGFSPLRITTTPLTMSSASSWPTRPCGGTWPMRTWATSRTSTGVLLTSATTTRSMSAEV